MGHVALHITLGFALDLKKTDKKGRLVPRSLLLSCVDYGRYITSVCWATGNCESFMTGTVEGNI